MTDEVFINRGWGKGNVNVFGYFFPEEGKKRENYFSSTKNANGISAREIIMTIGNREREKLLLAVQAKVMELVAKCIENDIVKTDNEIINSILQKISDLRKIEKNENKMRKEILEKKDLGIPLTIEEEKINELPVFIKMCNMIGNKINNEMMACLDSDIILNILNNNVKYITKVERQELDESYYFCDAYSKYLNPYLEEKQIYRPDLSERKQGR